MKKKIKGLGRGRPGGRACRGKREGKCRTGDTRCIVREANRRVTTVQVKERIGQVVVVEKIEVVFNHVSHVQEDLDLCQARWDTGAPCDAHLVEAQALHSPAPTIALEEMIQLF